MPISRNQAFGALAILTGLVFGIMGIADAPGMAFAIVGAVVGAIYAFGGLLWKPDPTSSDRAASRAASRASRNSDQSQEL